MSMVENLRLMKTLDDVWNSQSIFMQKRNFVSVKRLLPLICVSLVIVGSGCIRNPSNNPPAVNAGVDQVVNAGGSVMLDGSGSSDPDGDAISFSWKQILGTPVSLSGASSPIATFKAPTNGSVLSFELTVSDGKSESIGKTSVAIRLVDLSVQIVEMHQRSVTEDPAVMGNFSNDWLIADAGAGLPQPSPDDLELPEFIELFKNTRAPRIVQEDLSPGATRTVSLQIADPSGLAGYAQWIGTISPLNVTIALDGSTLATGGTTYHMGRDRGGSYLQTRTTAGGLATMSVTNTAGMTVKVRIIFTATDLK